MLAKKHRFRGRPSLNLVFRRGTITRGRSVSIRFYPKSTEDLRAAVVVSRKVHKNAVVRNKIRRRVYAFLEAQMNELKKGDLVVTIHEASLAEIESQAFSKIMSDILKRGHVLS